MKDLVNKILTGDFASRKNSFGGGGTLSRRTGCQEDKRSSFLHHLGSVTINQIDRSRVEHGMTNISFAQQTDNSLSSCLLALRKSFAFTLAEVLITLGIIGIVAAMTLPTLSADYQKKVTVKKLRVAYNLFSNAIEMAKIDHGNPIILPPELIVDTNLTKELSELYLEPYIKGAEYFSDNKIVYIKRPDKISTAWEYGIGYERYAVCIPSGLCYKIWRHSTGYIRLYIDLNGPKGPNVSGRDAFVLDMTDKYYSNAGYIGLAAPHPFVEGSWSAFGMTIDGACNKNSDGLTCASKIINDGWKISPDYPW